MADAKSSYPDPWHFLPTKEGISFIYEGSDTFTVVRNPYDRVLSSYYFYHRRTPDNFLTRQHLNDWVLNRLTKSWRCNPQSLYTHDEDGSKTIDHVLHFESLDADFRKLMKKYELNVVLPTQAKNVRRSTAKMSMRHLSRQAIQIINEYYDCDFKYFGLEKIIK